MSVSLKVIKSALLLLSTQLIQRGLGIVSTLILARLLTPDDFGVIALITILLQLFELLVETGNQQYIVQKDAVDDLDLNTAWSMDILIKTSLAVIVVLLSPAFAAFFEEPDLALAVSVAALALPIRALRNPGLMRLARDLNYRPLFRLTVWQKLLSFCAVIGFALFQASYWAIVLGNLVSATVLAAGSYLLHRHRPAFTLVRLREQWGFSQWLLLRGLVGFTRSQVDNLLVSRFFGTQALGGYNLVREVSLLPALSILIPMSEPLLAATAQVKHRQAQLAYRVRLSSALMITLLVPITVFLMLFPTLTVEVLLGPQWRDYADLLRPFGLFFFTFSFFALLSDVVIALGKVRALLLFDLVSTAVILSLLLVLATGNLPQMAWARGWLAVATTWVLLMMIRRWTGFGLARLAYLSLPAMLGGAGAGTLTWSLALPWAPPLLEFLIRGSLFVGLYAVLLLVGARLLLAGQEEWWQLRSVVRQSLGRGPASREPPGAS